MVEWIMEGKTNAKKQKRQVQIALKKSTEYQSLIKDANFLIFIVEDLKSET